MIPRKTSGVGMIEVDNCPGMNGMSFTCVNLYACEEHAVLLQVSLLQTSLIKVLESPCWLDLITQRMSILLSSQWLSGR